MAAKKLLAMLFATCFAFSSSSKTRGGYFMDAWERFSEIKAYGMPAKSPNRPFPVKKDGIRDACEWEITIRRAFYVFGNLDYERLVEICKTTKDELQVKLCVDCLDGAGQTVESYYFDQNNYIDAVSVLSKAMFSRSCSVNCETP